MKELMQQLVATAELKGADLSPNALAVMAKDLEGYSPQVISQALNAYRKTSGRFSLDGIITQIEKLNPNARISADEAWALYPHNEEASAVITDEIAEAMGVAQPLLNEGDKIGARMAFKNAYERITERNKQQGIEPKWFPSLGSEQSSRETAVNDAVRLGRLPAKAIQTLLPPPIDHKFQSNVLQLKTVMQVEDKATPEQKEKARQKIAQIKSMLAKG